MSDYLDREKDVQQDTKQFLDSEYGQYIMSTLDDMATGLLAHADNMEAPYPERYLAKHSAIKEVIDLIKSPLDDDTPTRG